MTYRRDTRVEFNHCDPAGIVFYPRYFEMTNSVIENFFRDVASHPFEDMMACGTGVPTARLETDFRAPSRLGDLITWRLSVRKLGTASATFQLAAHCGDELRLTALLTLVWLGPGRRPAPWPDHIRAALAAHQETP